MSRPYPQVGIVVDVKEVQGDPFHVVGEKYISAIANGCQCYPVLLPAMGQGPHLNDITNLFDIDQIVAHLDGLFLPGSISNVNPAMYGEELQTPQLPVDHQRDATAITMILSAVKHGVPLLAVCRGFQELNIAFGGSLHQKIHEVDGYMDHREDASAPRERWYDHAHEINIVDNSLLFKLWGKSTARVNSLHGQGIDRLGEGLNVEARAEDSLIEAVSVTKSTNFAFAVQWHPEWHLHEDELSKAIFGAFSKQVNKRFQKLRRQK